MKDTLGTAVNGLRSGGVVACPTEAVWGLSCDPEDRTAVASLLELKGRPEEKGLILVAGAPTQFKALLEDISECQKTLLSESWPGPITWLVPHQGRVPSWITGDHDKVALRVTDHPVMSTLCAAWGAPLVSSSANPAGLEPARTFEQVEFYFDSGLSAIVPGEIGGRPSPSQIIDLDTGAVIRA